MMEGKAACIAIERDASFFRGSLCGKKPDSGRFGDCFARNCKPDKEWIERKSK